MSKKKTLTFFVWFFFLLLLSFDSIFAVMFIVYCVAKGFCCRYVSNITLLYSVNMCGKQSAQYYENFARTVPANVQFLFFFYNRTKNVILISLSWHLFRQCNVIPTSMTIEWVFLDHFRSIFFVHSNSELNRGNNLCCMCHVKTYCYNEKLNLPLSWKLMNTYTHSFTYDNENTIPDEIMYGLNWCKFLETENNVLSLAIDLVYWNNTQSKMWLFHRPPLYVDRSLYQATKNYQNFTFNFFLLRAVRFYNPRMNFSCVSEFHRFSAKTIVTTFWISSKALTFSEVKLPRGNTCRKGLKMSKCWKYCNLYYAETPRVIALFHVPLLRTHCNFQFKFHTNCVDWDLVDIVYII